MPQQPKTITNPRTGQRMTFISQSPDELQIDSVNPPTDVPAPLRLHPQQETDCRVLSGTLLFDVGGERRTVTAGQTITVPAGTPYCFHIEGSEDAHSIQSFRPALNTADFFETYFELARRGKLDKRGIPKPLALATMLTAFGDTVRPVNPPWPVLRLLATVLGPIARARGYHGGLRARSQRNHNLGPGREQSRRPAGDTAEGPVAIHRGV
jgi:mannose-6-phosphate isomerase-like protein (cupin superfamily)